MEDCRIDELMIGIYKQELEDLKALIRTEIENANTLDVDLGVEMDIGLN